MNTTVIELWRSVEACPPVHLERACCLSGFFSDGVGLTMFQLCAVDSSSEQQTACDRCLESSTSVSRPLHELCE